MSAPGRTRAAALSAALSATLIVAMAGAAVAFGDAGCTARDRGACGPTPVAALSATPPTPTPTPTVPSPEPTPSVAAAAAAARWCGPPTAREACDERDTSAVGAAATGPNPKP